MSLAAATIVATRLRWLAAAVAALGCVGAARADVDVDVSLAATSDYDFRGISQSRGQPALQLGASVAQRWLRASAWTSSVDFGPFVAGRRELDLAVGLGHEVSAGWTWEALATAYRYPGAQARRGAPLDPADDVAPTEDYGEVSFGVAGDRFSARYWFSPSLYATDASASYLEAGAKLALRPKLALGLHAGYSFGAYFDAAGGADYYDASIGLERSMARFNFGVQYVWTAVDPRFEVVDGAFRNDARWIFTVGAALGWNDSTVR